MKRHMYAVAVSICLLLLSGCTQSPGEAVPPPAVRTPTPATPTPTFVLTPAPSEPVVIDPVPIETPEQEPAPVRTVAPSRVPVPTPEPELTLAPVPTEPVPTATPIPTPSQTPQPPSPTETVLSAFHLAQEAYGWFEVAPLPMSEETVEINGVKYHRVDYPGITSLADLRGYLKTLFSDEIVDRLMGENLPQYTDLDGILFAVNGGRGTDPTKGEETYAVIEDSATKYSVQVTVQLTGSGEGAGGSEVHSFPYEQVGDKWIFTEFYQYR